MRGTLAFLLVIEAHRPTTYGPMYSMSYPTYDKPLYYVVHMPWLAYYHVLRADATLPPNVLRGTCMAFPAPQHPPLAK